jgi:hypothetical protein
MKQLLSLFLFLLPCLAWAQYPSNGNQKITLGEQTTADGLIYRGVLGDTALITPSSDTSAYIILDTANHRFYNYNRATNVWSVAGGGTAVTTFSAGTTGLTPSTATSGAVTLGGTLAVANGGTNTTTLTANKVMVGNGTSGVLTPTNLHWDNTNSRLGIGTASPQTKLHVANSSSAILLTESSSVATIIGTNAAGTASQELSLRGFPLTFTGNGGGGSEAMRITSGGNVGIGTASPSRKLIVYDTDSNVPTIGLRTNGSGILTDDGFDLQFASSNTFLFNRENGYMSFGTNNNERMQITSGGEIYVAPTTDRGAYNLQVNGTGVWGAGDYINGSDFNIKNNIEELDSSLYLINTLKPVTFKYDESYNKDESYQVGFIAQDVFQNFENKKYVNGIIKSDGDILSMSYSSLIPILTKAIQEQNALIKALEQRIINLENK